MWVSLDVVLFWGTNVVIGSGVFGFGLGDRLYILRWISHAHTLTPYMLGIPA